MPTIEEKAVNGKNTNTESYCEIPKDIQDRINAMR